MSDKITLSRLNEMPTAEAAAVCGGFFENSPWIVETALDERPFGSIEAFRRACMRVIREAPEEEQVALIRAHPDLVGRLAREGRLTRESTAEQAAAGLDALREEEIERFESYNRAYKERFGFPFVICARQNKKEAILEAFPKRLEQDRTSEIETALREIGEIAGLRMADALTEKEE